MFQLIHSASFGELFFGQLLSFMISLGIANYFYKFGAFLPEALAFLATWYVIDAIFMLVKKRLGFGSSTPPSPYSDT